MKKLKVVLCRLGKNRVHIVNSVFNDDFRTLDLFAVGALCRELQVVCLLANKNVR